MTTAPTKKELIAEGAALDPPVVLSMSQSRTEMLRLVRGPGVYPPPERNGDRIEEAELIEAGVPTTASVALVPTDPTDLIEPAASLETIDAAFKAYKAACENLLVASDYQRIGNREFRKKSGWRKLAVAYGVSCEILDRSYERVSDRIIRAEILVRATAPNGRYMDGLGACDLFERCCNPHCKNTAQYHSHCPAKEGNVCDVAHFSNPQHDIPATASTRATNRACADLFGLGEVSAEEIIEPHAAEVPPGSPADGSRQDLPAGASSVLDADPVAPTERAALRKRIVALPPEVQADMMTKWVAEGLGSLKPDEELSAAVPPLVKPQKAAAERLIETAEATAKERPPDASDAVSEAGQPNVPAEPQPDLPECPACHGPVDEASQHPTHPAFHEWCEPPGTT